MAPSYRLILVLLLGLTVTSAEDTLCHLNNEMTRCVCKAQPIDDPDRVFCIMALELELRDGKVDLGSLMGLQIDMNYVKLLPMEKLIFNNITVSTVAITTIIPFLSLSKVKEVNILSSTVEHVIPSWPSVSLKKSKIKTLVLENVTVDSVLLSHPFHELHQWLFSSLTSLRLVHSGLVEFDCYWAEKAKNLIHLDLSENPISLASLQNVSHCSSLSYKYLKSLHLRHSGLTSLQALCTLLSLTTALTDLDVSGNNFSVFHFPYCLQMKPLRMLNLSHSGITEVNSALSATLEELDLSYNSLEVFSNPLQSLKKLNLSNNRLKTLHFLTTLIHLKELNVDSNQLTVLINETEVSLNTVQQLDVLYARRNPYHCDFGLRETIDFLKKAHSVAGDLDSYLCETPTAQKGTPIMKYMLETTEEPVSRAQHNDAALCFMLFVGLLPQLIYMF
ncbi:monocyte differentiation antigen CD14-like [Cheilinus undulatus]|uniref:monocyte differentiation antigen CD14-like n=1 Tax=Cheilinus undulatus TaxID=241271 RepID=UPI001BD3B037|nr:monocyte differentiation antigen CD14-like [Cheilinus undulatus]